MPRQSATTAIASPLPRARTSNLPLKLAIIKSGIPQGTIARRLRISIFRLSRIVHGRQTPTINEQYRLAEILSEPRQALFREVAP